MRYLLALCLVMVPVSALGSDDGVMVMIARQCAALDDATSRLACYDLVFKTQVSAPEDVAPDDSTPDETPAN